MFTEYWTSGKSALSTLASRFKKDERGVTLVEIVLVLSIIGIITVVAYQNFGGADAAAKGNRFVQETQFMAERAKQAFRSQRGFGTLNAAVATSLMCDRNVIPTQFCNGGTATDANGGAITFVFQDTEFTLTRNAVPISVCQEALPEFNTGDTTRPADITVNGGGATQPENIDVQQANTLCANRTNVVAFRYDKR